MCAPTKKRALNKSLQTALTTQVIIKFEQMFALNGEIIRPRCQDEL